MYTVLLRLFTAYYHRIPGVKKSLHTKNFFVSHRPRYPKRVLYSLVTIPGTLDACIYKLRDTDTPSLHLCGTKMTKIFWAKNFKKCGWLRVENLNNFPWNSGFPGGLLGINFMIQQENLDFATAHPLLFAHFQIRSKTAKTAKKLQKCQNLADLSVLSKNFSAKLRFDRFWRRSDQKKLIFGTFQNFQDFTTVKWPNSKSGPFGPILAPKSGPGHFLLSKNYFLVILGDFGIFGEKLYQKIEKIKVPPLLSG